MYSKLTYIIISCSIGAFIALLGKIVWDWLANRNKSDLCNLDDLKDLIIKDKKEIQVILNSYRDRLEKDLNGLGNKVSQQVIVISNEVKSINVRLNKDFVSMGDFVEVQQKLDNIKERVIGLEKYNEFKQDS